ncbi:trigger factor [Ascidiimonas aurantiaca]|uniref:trigger factor n=1 Tax=Ascidiimonas aurantiaca TaxID=1685432 RepID=UPI0030EBB08C
MDITREHIDDLNAIVKVAISKEDYSDKVDEILKDYRKKANIPGFRKGHVPLGLVKKQYGRAVLVDEVNKLLQDALEKYLTEEKLDVLGNPLPRQQDDFNWEAENFSFEFELGLSPEFEVELASKKPITQYKIVADDKMIDRQIESMRKQYGKLITKETAEESDEITGTFLNEENNINNKTTFPLSRIKGKKNTDLLKNAKKGDEITLNTKGLFEDDHDLMRHLKLDHEGIHDLKAEVVFKVEEINGHELAELNQELFDKLFGKDTVTSLEEMKARIKEDAEQQFKQQADQKLINDMTTYLVENTKFDLPANFLKKWIQVTGEAELSEDEASQEFEKSEKGLRYQLIEKKIVQENDLQVSFDELKEFAKGFIKAQMAQFGQVNPSEEDLENIASRVLSNQDEVRRLSDQLMSHKLLEVYREKANLKSKEITYDDFIKEVYGD